jgi:hypothetical protein
MTFRLPLGGAVAILLTLAVGCTTFSLSEQSGDLAVTSHPRARDAALVVLPFPFSPEDPDDAGQLTEHDLASWQRILTAGLDQTNILESVVAAPGGGAPATGDYALGGRITRFQFRKSWVPTLIPIHLSLSFLTFTGYTLFGGSTAATVVRFFCVHAQDQRLLGSSGEPLRKPEPGLLEGRRFHRGEDHERASLTENEAIPTIDSR